MKLFNLILPMFVILLFASCKISEGLFPARTFRFKHVNKTEGSCFFFVYDFTKTKTMIAIQPDSLGFYMYNIPDLHYSKKSSLGIPISSSNPLKYQILQIKKGNEQPLKTYTLEEVLNKDEINTGDFTLIFTPK